jgi:hypothetical protein
MVLDLPHEGSIHRSGGAAATLADVAAYIQIHPAKLPDLQHVTELLSTMGIFTATASKDSGDAVYGLTTACRFLVGHSKSCGLTSAKGLSVML